jgi:anti-sigma factor ChrR (cupin superfamily)
MPAITTLDALDSTPHAEVFEEGSPRTVRLRLDAGEAVPEHRHPGTTIVLHVLSGTLDLRLDGDSHTLQTADVARFSGDREIAPIARADTDAILVFTPTA